MTFSILFVANNRIQIDILHTSENITLDKWVRLFQCPNQLFDLHTFGFCFFVITGGAGVSKFTSTLNEMQIVIISPRLDAVLADQMHRTDQFHPAEIGAVQLWHHGLYLCAVQHTHQDGLDDIVIVMAESNLIYSPVPVRNDRDALFAFSHTDSTGTDLHGRLPQKYPIRKL